MPISIDGKSKVHKYQQLADYLRQQIAEGQLPPNGPLPSFNEMRIRFDFTQRTVEKAHTLLEADGLIRRDPGRGGRDHVGRWARARRGAAPAPRRVRCP